MRDWKPIFVENSLVPKVLSLISPISIGAITLGFIVFSRFEMNERVDFHQMATELVRKAGLKSKISLA